MLAVEFLFLWRYCIIIIKFCRVPDSRLDDICFYDYYDSVVLPFVMINSSWLNLNIWHIRQHIPNRMEHEQLHRLLWIICHCLSVSTSCRPPPPSPLFPVRLFALNNNKFPKSNDVSVSDLCVCVYIFDCHKRFEFDLFYNELIACGLYTRCIQPNQNDDQL